MVIIENLDLSIKFKDDPIPNMFDEEDRKCESVLLVDCKNVEFIPIKLLQRYPNLKNFTISYSEIIQVPKNLFTADLQKLQLLILDNNKIEKIDVEAFSTLTELNLISLKGNEIEEIPHKIFEKNLKLKMIDLSDNLIHSLHPELFDGLTNLKEVNLMNNLRFSKKTGQENISKLKEELKPLFDSYIKKYGKKAVSNWQENFESLQIELQKRDQEYEFLLEKYNQSKQELQEFSEKLEDIKILTTTKDLSLGKVSSELLKNYEKLKEIDGDIVLEFQDGKILKAHRAVLIGKF
jgi:Leucine-rich repeat (LRR) protein